MDPSSTLVSKSKAAKISSINNKEPILKKRYIQGLLLFLQVTVAYGLRTNLAVAIVAMTTSSSNNPDIHVLNWKDTSIILSSFYWTYAALQFFAGPLGQVHGPKWYIIAGLFMNSLACFLTPLISLSIIGQHGVIACRLVQGFFQGIMLPLVHTMLGRWAPAEERSWMTSTIYSGAGLGSILATYLTGVISASRLGWPASFYIFGSVGFAVCIIWTIMCYNSPAEHPRISEAERKHIEISLGQDNDTLLAKTIPWKPIFSSLPFWAIIVASIGESWGSTLMSTETPTYLSKTENLDIESSALYSSAPYAVSILVSLACGPISDYLISKHWLSRINARRLFQAIGSFLPSISLIWLAYVSENRALIAVLLIVAFSSSSALMSGHMVNIIDIAPRFSGVVWGIANGIGQAIAILAPVLVNFVVTDESDKTLWRIMFFTTAAIYSGSSLFFILYLSGDKQWWDNIPKEQQNT